MPDGMPYYVEKGAYFSLLDSLSERPAHELLEIRDLLVDGVEIATVAAGLDPPSQPPQDPFGGAAFGQHLDDDWFGKNDPSDQLTTGWWKGYQGSVEPIMRETLVRAIEVSLGVPHGSPAAECDPPSRHWPIQFFWICGPRWFEGWVSWREWGESVSGSSADPQIASTPHSGVVTVMFVTPGMQNKTIYRRPERPERAGEPDYRVNPDGAAGPNGLWVISAEDHKAEIIGKGIGWKKVDAGKIAIPAWFEDTIFKDQLDDGVPVVVAPAEIDGGVLDAGRNW